MKIVFFVNDAFDIQPSQTTYLFIKETLVQKNEVWISSVPRTTNEYVIQSHKASIKNSNDFFITPETIPLDLMKHIDIIWIRTNPNRDLENFHSHLQLLDLLEKISNNGKIVINKPQGLKKFIDKSYLLELPECTIPKTRLAKNHKEFLAQLKQFSGKVVCKPLAGTRGQGVVCFDTSNPPSHIEFPLLIQEFIHTETHGDQRIYLLNGKPFESEGKVLIIHRRPPHGDFRSNLHLGGSPEKTILNKSQLETINHIEDILSENGIFQAGIDMMENKIIEINVFAPGGVFPANCLYGQNFEIKLFNLTLQTLHKTK